MGIWDIKARKQTGTLLGQIGDGEDGMVQAIAVSPDGKYVVAIVWLSTESHFSGERDSDVRVFELATGNLQARFRYPGTLQDLDFSSDGAYLAMVANPKGPIRCGYVYLYDSSKIMQGFGKLPSPLKNHVNLLYDNDTLIHSYVRFIPQEKGRAPSVCRRIINTTNMDIRVGVMDTCTQVKCILHARNATRK